MLSLSSPPLSPSSPPPRRQPFTPMPIAQRLRRARTAPRLRGRISRLPSSLKVASPVCLAAFDESLELSLDCTQPDFSPSPCPSENNSSFNFLAAAPLLSPAPFLSPSPPRQPTKRARHQAPSHTVPTLPSPPPSPASPPLSSLATSGKRIFKVTAGLSQLYTLVTKLRKYYKRLPVFTHVVATSLTRLGRLLQHAPWLSSVPLTYFLSRWYRRILASIQTHHQPYVATAVVALVAVGLFRVVHRAFTATIPPSWRTPFLALLTSQHRSPKRKRPPTLDVPGPAAASPIPSPIPLPPPRRHKRRRKRRKPRPKPRPQPRRHHHRRPRYNHKRTHSRPPITPLSQPPNAFTFSSLREQSATSRACERLSRIKSALSKHIHS